MSLILGCSTTSWATSADVIVNEGAIYAKSPGGQMQAVNVRPGVAQFVTGTLISTAANAKLRLQTTSNYFLNLGPRSSIQLTSTGLKLLSGSLQVEKPRNDGQSLMVKFNQFQAEFFGQISTGIMYNSAQLSSACLLSGQLVVTQNRAPMASLTKPNTCVIYDQNQPQQPPIRVLPPAQRARLINETRLATTAIAENNSATRPPSAKQPTKQNDIASVEERPTISEPTVPVDDKLTKAAAEVAALDKAAAGRRSSKTKTNEIIPSETIPSFQANDLAQPEVETGTARDYASDVFDVTASAQSSIRLQEPAAIEISVPERTIIAEPATAGAPLIRPKLKSQNDAPTSTQPNTYTTPRVSTSRSVVVETKPPAAAPTQMLPRGSDLGPDSEQTFQIVAEADQEPVREPEVIQMTAVQPVLGASWNVYVRSTPDIIKADATQQKLADLGYASTLILYNHEGTDYFRVTITNLDSKNAANQVRRQLSSKHGFKGSWIAKAK